MKVDGEKIRILRKKAGMSQYKLSLKIDALRGSISDWENDKSNPSKKFVKQLAEVFNVPIRVLRERE